MIDDGKRGRQHQWSSLSETIYTMGADFAPSVAAAMAKRAEDKYSAEEGAEWADLLLSTADVPDAFRGLPIALSDQRAALVEVFHVVLKHLGTYWGPWGFSGFGLGAPWTWAGNLRTSHGECFWKGATGLGKQLEHQEGSSRIGEGGSRTWKPHGGHDLRVR